MWSRATQRAAATPVAPATPASTNGASSGWKLGGTKARRNSDGATNALASSPPKAGFTRVSNGSGSTKKARNGLASVPRKVTIEEVPDEEAVVDVDGSLGVESRYLLESTEEIERQQQELQHPRPSMPPSSYSGIFSSDHYDDGFSSANSSYVPQTPSTAPTSPPDDVPPMSKEEAFSNAARNFKLQQAAQGHRAPSSASGSASDWDATVRQNLQHAGANGVKRSISQLPNQD
ncbi:hypothetical protein NMY22_g20297 [Coprinellus aureogranulatus]|nr:hypothetical protein NMY22_g20297 [Coprinellus aureogranulatus]